MPKPINPQRVRQIFQASSIMEADVHHHAITSAASGMRMALESMRRPAQSDFPVMLRGENGTGKTMIAECLHRHSNRAAHPFVTVNCP